MMTSEGQSVQEGAISWFKRVPPGWVETYRFAGWVPELVAPSHHDAHCVLMRFGRTITSVKVVENRWVLTAAS